MPRPDGPVWLPLPGPGPVQLVGLDAALPDPWGDYRDQRNREHRRLVKTFAATISAVIVPHFCRMI